MKKHIANFNNKWSALSKRQKTEAWAKYIVLSICLLSVLHLSFYIQYKKLETLVQQQNLNMCEQMVDTLQAQNTDTIKEDSSFKSAAPKTDSIQVVQNYFDAYNKGDIKTACGILPSSKCDPESKQAVSRFGEEKAKLTQGYQDLHLWNAEATDFHSDVVCVKYSYSYKNDLKPKSVTETLSFYVNEGTITARVCEQKLLDGKQGFDCPITAKKDFCKK